MRSFLTITKAVSFMIMAAIIVVASSSTNGWAAPEKSGEQKMAINPIPVQEYEAISKVIGLYVEAGIQAKSDIMKPAFHKDAIIYGFGGGQLSGGPIQGLFDFIDSHPKATNLKAEITTIDIVGDIAHVRAESDDWNGARYSDMFLLVKDGGQWKILTKTFFTHE